MRDDRLELFKNFFNKEKEYYEKLTPEERIKHRLRLIDIALEVRARQLAIEDIDRNKE